MKKLLFLLAILSAPVMVLQAQNKKAAADNSKDRIVQITTDFGTMKLRLYNETPTAP